MNDLFCWKQIGLSVFFRVSVVIVSIVMKPAPIFHQIDWFFQFWLYLHVFTIFLFRGISIDTGRKSCLFDKGTENFILFGQCHILFYQLLSDNFGFLISINKYSGLWRYSHFSHICSIIEDNKHCWVAQVITKPIFTCFIDELVNVYLIFQLLIKPLVQWRNGNNTLFIWDLFFLLLNCNSLIDFWLLNLKLLVANPSLTLNFYYRLFYWSF